MKGRSALKTVLCGCLVVRPVPLLASLAIVVELRVERPGRLHLLAAVDEALLHRWDPLFFLDTLLYARDLGAALVWGW